MPGPGVTIEGCSLQKPTPIRPVTRATRFEFDKSTGMFLLKELHVMRRKPLPRALTDMNGEERIDVGILRFIEFAPTLRYPERKRSALIRPPKVWKFGSAAVRYDTENRHSRLMTSSEYCNPARPQLRPRVIGVRGAT
jgi:hypothetical protein